MAGLGLNPNPRASVKPSDHNHPHSPPQGRRELPRGACNWRDLSIGQAASPCGCKQFWLNDAQLTYGAPSSQRIPHAAVGAWCFCGHHACFHAARSETQIAGPGTRSDMQLDTSWDFPNALGLDPEHAAAPPQTQQSQWKHAAFGASALGLHLGASDAQIQHTHASELPQPHLLERAAAAHLPSTQSSPKPASVYTSDAEYRQRRSPKTNFASQVARQRSKAPHVEVHDLPPPNTQDEAAAQSATELATPSYAGTPALRATDDAFTAIRTTLDAFNKNTAHNVNPATPLNTNTPQNRGSPTGQPPASPATVNQLMQQLAWLKNLLSASPNLRTSLLNLQSRVEALESASFSYVPAEEMQDRFDHFDGRILDIEGRMDELDRMQAVETNDPRSKLDQSFMSRGSISEDPTVPLPTAADARLINQSAALAHLARLEERLNDLEASALPSASAPWDVEVVYLPWGRNLAGLWCAQHEASQMSRSEAQNSASAAVSSLVSTQPSGASVLRSRSATRGTSSASQRTAPHEWSNGALDWLSARASGPSRGTAGRVYERLKSRGFVRSITLFENSAQGVESALTAAFANFMPASEAMSAHVGQSSVPTQQYLGLQAPFIPLRKIHKSSRLQHLAEAELVTPSLWTAEFLNAGVFMQTPTTGRRRLFVTSPAAYMQGSASPSWTWQKLRELPRWHPSGAEDDMRMDITVGEADANEPCWAWSAKLDPPISVNSSFSSHLSYHSSLDSKPLSPQQTAGQSSGTPSEGAESSYEPEQDASDGFDHAMEDKHRPRSPITPTSEFPSGRPTHEHRASSQPLTQLENSPLVTVPKRQVASFEHASSVRNEPKRRRFSRNTEESELAQIWNLTPRRSHEPHSPRGRRSSARQNEGMPSEEVMLAVPPKRIMTPQAYATPYSGEALMVEVPNSTESSQDTDFDSNDEAYSQHDGDGSDAESEPGWRSRNPVWPVDADDESEHDVDVDDEDEDDDEAWEGVQDDEQERG